MLTRTASLRCVRSWLAGIAGLICLWCLPVAPAHAQLAVAGDLDLVRPVAIDDLGMGGSLGLRLGTEWQGRLAVITPELGVSYSLFTKRGNQEYPPAVFRGVAGLRLGFMLGMSARLGMMAHVGVGYVQWSKHWYDDPYSEKRGYQDLSHSCFTYDAGVFLDFIVTWTTTFGLHVAYNRVTDDHKQNEPLDWLQFGLHGALLAL